MEEKKPKKSSNKIAAAVILGCLAILAVMLFLLMRGKTVTVGQYPDPVNSVGLSCTNVGNKYPIFTYDSADKRETTVSMIFSGEKLTSISLMHKLYYSSESLITGSEAHNHAAMNIDFGKNHLGADALGANYARLSDGMKMSLYAKADSVTSVTAKYFLINFDEYLPETVAELTENYTAQGFTCEKVE